jgi:hypothetical protein
VHEPNSAPNGPTNSVFPVSSLPSVLFHQLLFTESEEPDSPTIPTQTAITGHKLPSPALTPRGCYLITGKLTLYTNTHLSWGTHVSIRPITQAGLYAFVMVS